MIRTSAVGRWPLGRRAGPLGRPAAPKPRAKAGPAAFQRRNPFVLQTSCVAPASLRAGYEALRQAQGRLPASLAPTGFTPPFVSPFWCMGGKMPPHRHARMRALRSAAVRV